MYEFPFKEAFQRGIRPDDRNAPNTQLLQRCYNVAATPWGLRPCRHVVQPIPDAILIANGVVKSHPWPQLVKLKSLTLLLDKDAIFAVTEDPAGDWDVTAVTLYDWTTYDWDTDSATPKELTGGKDWHVIDLWNSVMLFNGSEIVFTTGFSDKVFVVDAVTIETGASYNDGRIFLGGFDSSDVDALADWTAYMQSLRGTVPAEAAKLISTNALNGNWVWWSSIGMEDMYRFFSLDYMKYGSLAASPDTGFDTANPLWLRLAQRGESGRTPMPSQGGVKRMLQLGDNMVVYSEDNACVLAPVNTAEVKTFGQTPIANVGAGIGIKQGTNVRAAVGGDMFVHGFVDEAGDFWIMDASLKADNLGYRHLLADLDDLLVHYDPQSREFHLAGVGASVGTVCYRYAQNAGMYRPRQVPTTVYFGRANDESGPIGIVDETADTDTARFRTEWFNAGKQKVVPQILRIVLDGDDGWVLSVHFKRTPDDSVQQSDLVTGDKRGSYEFNVSGVAFYIFGVHNDPDTATLNSLTVEMDDGIRRSVTKWQT